MDTFDPSTHISNAMSGAPLTELPGSGHMPHREYTSAKSRANLPILAS
ncbi:hypothetical protein [Tateyamaria sp. ANG-S1]|nr:hypothetical protein [Tateyamaria sp. ANG-S1]